MGHLATDKFSIISELKKLECDEIYGGLAIGINNYPHKINIPLNCLRKLLDFLNVYVPNEENSIMYLNTTNDNQ